MARGRNRSTNPLTIAAAAITRALDPIEPSRVTVLRLLADAIRLLRETIKDMSDDDGRSPRERSYSPLAYVSGAQAIAASSFTCLMRHGARGGPLRQRAIVLFRLAASVVKATSFLSQAAVDARAHIAGLKRDSDTTREVFDAQVASALLVLAEASNPRLAGVDVARDSVLFLLGPKMKGLASRRSDVALAAAQIMSSFTAELKPEPRLLDRSLEYALAGASTKLGVGGVGCALLMGACCPFLTQKVAAVLHESVTASISRALAAAPTHAEKNVWAVALARAVVATQKISLGGRAVNGVLPDPAVQSNARGGLSKYLYRREQLPSDAGGAAVNGGSSQTAVPCADAKELRAGIVGAQLFESSLTQMAMLCAGEAREGALWGLASVLRMWSSACPKQAPAIVARAVELAEPFVTSSAVLSCVMDAIVLGVWDDIRPDEAPHALWALLHVSLADNSARALSLYLAAEVVFTFGADAVANLCLREHHLVFLLDAVQLALSANYSSLRSAGVALLTAVAGAAPQKRAMLLTLVLQNLRIADVQLAMKPHQEPEAEQGSLGAVGEELSALLGNAAALAAVVEEIACCIAPENSPASAALEDSTEAGPSALLAQCALDAEALLTPHPVAACAFPHGCAVAFVRKRAGWALLAALSRSGIRECVVADRVERLGLLWQEELGLPRNHTENGSSVRDSTKTRSEAGDVQADAQASPDIAQERSASSPSVPFDEVKASSASRVAALSALAAYLRATTDIEFRELANALLGATAARLSVVDAGIVPVDGGSSSFATAVASAAIERRSDSVDESGVTGSATAAFEYSFHLDSEGRHFPSKRGSTRSGTSKDAAASAEEARRRTRKRTLARLCAVESERLLECVQLTSLSGASAELCYHIATAYGEDAQRVMGDGAGVLASGGNVAAPAAHALQFYTFGSIEGGVMVNCRYGLSTKVLRARARAHGKYGLATTAAPEEALELDEREQGNGSDTLSQTSALRSTDLGWLFNTEAAEVPVAERALGSASEAIAALIAGDRAVSGTLLESLISSTSLTPAFCASIARALSRRLSVSELNGMGTGRAVASLQVLLRRALTGTMALSEYSKSNSTKQTSTPYAGYSTVMSSVEDCHGSALLLQSGELSWQAWAHAFLWELSCDDGCGFSEESRITKLASAIRLLTSEAYCELGRKGGDAMWLGLTRGVIDTLREALESKALSQVMLASNSCTVLGSLVGSAPNALPDTDSPIREKRAFTFGMAESAAIGEVSEAAVAALATALEASEPFVQAAAACALSDTSKWTAVNSERLFANLVCAWAASEGSCGFVSRRSAQMEEASLAMASLRRSWFGMVRGSEAPFFDFDAQGPGVCAGAYGMGAAAVLAACRQHWWPYNESCASAGGEIALDLIRWNPISSPRTVAAGLYCFAALWATRIDAVRADGADDVASPGSSRSSVNSLSSGHRLFRASRSPRGSVRSSAELRVPASPLFSASNSYVFPDDLSADSGRERPILGGDEDLLSRTFDVGEVSHLDVLEQILSCTSVEGMGTHLQEVRTAGTAALAQLVRGVGPKRALDLCPRLPFALFTAFDGGAAGADLLLGLCVRSNITRWFGFWINLCRAYFFGSGGRINLPGAPVDFVQRSMRASSRTRSFAVAIARYALEAAAASSGFDFAVLASHDDTLASSCASAVDLACAACLANMSNAAEEGCMLLLGIFKASGSISLCNQRREQISSALRHVMCGSRPYGVVQHAIRAACYFLSSICLDELLLSALLGDGKPQELHMVYKYDKYAEHVGAEAVLATLGQISALVSAAVNEDDCQDLRDALGPYLGTLRRMFFAVVVDFASALSDGMDILAHRGGSLTAAGVSPAPLRVSLMKHLSSIALGAAALSSRHEHDLSEASGVSVPWCNSEAPGARMVDGNLKSENVYEIERVVLSVWTWLVTQQLESHYSEDEDGFQQFCEHAAQAIPSLILCERLPEGERIEALLSLRSLDSKTMLTACLVVSRSSNFGHATSKLLQAAFQLCMDQLTENPIGFALEMGFQTGANILRACVGTEHNPENSQTVLDVFLFLINLPGTITLDEFAHRETQRAICDALATALEAVDDKTVANVLADVESLLERSSSNVSTRLSGLVAVICCLGLAHPQAAGVQAVTIFERGDEIVDSLLVCEFGADFAISCLEEKGAVRLLIPVEAATAVYTSLVRRMTFGRGPPRQAAVRVLVRLHTLTNTSASKESVLSTLLPALSKDMTSGRDGTKAALQELKESDTVAFEKCVELLSPSVKQTLPTR